MSKTIGAPTCYCGSPSHLDSNVKIYNGKEYGNGMVWLCDRFPECRGSVGCHPDSRPLGTIADEATKEARKRVHAVIDPLWQVQTRGKQKARGSVYGYISEVTGIKPYHTGSLTEEQCELVLEKVKEKPYVQRHKVEELKRYYNPPKPNPPRKS